MRKQTLDHSLDYEEGLTISFSTESRDDSFDHSFGREKRAPYPVCGDFRVFSSSSVFDGIDITDLLTEKQRDYFRDWVNRQIQDWEA